MCKGLCVQDGMPLGHRLCRRCGALWAAQIWLPVPQAAHRKAVESAVGLTGGHRGASAAWDARLFACRSSQLPAQAKLIPKLCSIN